MLYRLAALVAFSQIGRLSKSRLFDNGRLTQCFSFDAANNVQTSLRQRSTTKTHVNEHYVNHHDCLRSYSFEIIYTTDYSSFLLRRINKPSLRFK